MSAASYYDITDGGTVSSDQKFKEEVTYADARGNIATLKRNGMYPDGAAWKVGQIDNLTYTSTSGTDRLASVSDAASVAAAKPFGFNPDAGGTGYGYDKNGNLIKDTYKGTTAITYNYLNLPVKISFGSSKSITFTYDATGRKLKKVTAGGAGAENYTQYYADGLEYRSTTLEAIYHEEGRLTPKTSTTWQYEYSIRDHLGNTRITFADKNGDNKISVTNLASTNEVLQENHYTPFGLELGYAWMNDAALADSKYRYNGKEFNTDFGLKLNDYGARWYDPAVGRFASVDPMASSMPSWSPYNYVLGNPTRLVDPTGKRPEDIIIKQSTNGGVTVVDITVRGKVVNLSSNEMYSSQVDSYARQLNGTTLFNGDAGDVARGADGATRYSVRVTFDFQAVSSLNEIKDGDHVIAIVDDIPRLSSDGPNTATDPGGRAQIGGHVATVEYGSLKGRTSKHELGHLIGLDHVSSASRLMNGVTAGGSSASVGMDEMRAIVNTHASPNNGTTRRGDSNGSPVTMTSQADIRAFLKESNIKYEKKRE